MRSQKLLFFLCSVFYLSLLVTQQAQAVRPISATIALAAGQEGHAGFKDGSFTSALFNTPLGLTISNDGTRLFVADSGNNRIRIIHLNQNNDVTTLAGQDLAGKLDGPLEKATFNNPYGVLYLPGDRLIVNDFGNQLLRLVDMKARTVTTLGIGLATQVSMNGIRDIVFMTSANSIFYTQPDLGSLKMLNLKTGLVSTVFNNNTQLPHPAALWCQENKLYIADKDLPQVYEIDWKDKTTVNPVLIATTLAKVLSLSFNGNILYALLANPGVPAERLLSNSQFDNQLVSLRSPGGDTIPEEELFPLQQMSFAPSIGFIPDASDNRKFYVSKPEYNIVVSFRDLFGFIYAGPDDRNSNGLNENEYPAKKPKNTYRILLVGDSRSQMILDYPFYTDFHTKERANPYPRILSMPKQIERELNLQAALDGVLWNYEVLNVSHTGSYWPLFLWPTYELPDIVKRNDIDLVVIFMTRSGILPVNLYFDNPITSEGIPKCPNDMEYLLKPPLERIPNGIPRSFYDFCKTHELVKIEGNSFNFDQRLFSYPELHESLVQLYGKPVDILNKKLSGMKTSSGQTVRLLLCTTYTGRLWESPEDPQIWVDAAKKFNFPIWDLNAEINALQLSYFPLTGDTQHLNPDGHIFYGRLLANDLIRGKLIPWK
jgi:hypothetical protein